MQCYSSHTSKVIKVTGKAICFLNILNDTSPPKGVLRANQRSTKMKIHIPSLLVEGAGGELMYGDRG